MDGEAKSCTFRWEIQNVSQCWWLWNEEGIYSPVFTADELKGSKWSLCFITIRDEYYISFGIKREKDCGALDAVLKIHFHLTCLDINGSLLSGGRMLTTEFEKNSSITFAGLLERDKLFINERELFIPEDTLTVQYTMWVEKEKPVKTNYIFATTNIEVNRRSFLWQIHKPTTLECGILYKFKDLINFHLVFCKGFYRFEIKVASVHDSVKYISCKTSVIDSEGKKKNCGIKKFYFGGSNKAKTSSVLHFPDTLPENKNLYFPNDILSLHFEFVVSTIEHFGLTANFVKMLLYEKDEDNEDGQKSEGLEKDEDAMRCRPGTSKELPSHARAIYPAIGGLRREDISELCIRRFLEQDVPSKKA